MKVARYNKIDYSIVNISELEGELRIDAEYYDPFYLKNEEKIKRKRWDFLEKITYFYVNGDEIRTYYSTGIPYLRVSDIKPFFLDLNNVVYVHKDSKIKESIKLEEGDILISRSGTLGISAMVDERLKGSIISSHLIRIKPIQKKINSYYLVAFLNSKHGVISILQKNNGAVVPEINHTGLNFLKIPIPSEEFQKFIENLVLKAYEERQKAERLYKQAEEILLEELELKDWKSKTKKIKVDGREFEEEENISIRTLSDVVEADRMDAEYWEPKYDEFLIKLKRKVRLRPLKDFLVSDILKGIEVGSKNYQDEGIPFIRVSNINKFGIIERDPKYISEELYLKLKDRYEPQKGEILLTKDATPGIAYVVKENLKGIIASGIVRLNVVEVEKEYLVLVINSIIGRIQIIREGGGSIISHWKPKQIKNLLIPEIDSQIQQKISQLIQQSFKARENSKKLLRTAKRAVEIFIEEDENRAISYISKNIDESNNYS